MEPVHIHTSKEKSHTTTLLLLIPCIVFVALLVMLYAKFSIQNQTTNVLSTSSELDIEGQ